MTGASKQFSNSDGHCPDLSQEQGGQRDQAALSGGVPGWFVDLLMHPTGRA